MFGASQLWGKVGRAFLRSISERQCARSPSDDSFSIDEALELSLKQWRKLIEGGPPRPIELKRHSWSDVVVFTDGFTPDPRDFEKLPDRVGGVLFDRRLNQPLQFTSIVPKSVQKRWLTRKTQIVPVEMIAAVLALTTFSDRIRNCDMIILIDSEAVEAALVKGYSSKEDLCLLISKFWDEVFDLKVRVFIDRVSTDSNPADWPSRNDLATGEKAGWATVEAVWPAYLLKWFWSTSLLLGKIWAWGVLLLLLVTCLCPLVPPLLLTYLLLHLCLSAWCLGGSGGSAVCGRWVLGGGLEAFWGLVVGAGLSSFGWGLRFVRSDLLAPMPWVGKTVLLLCRSVDQTNEVMSVLTIASYTHINKEEDGMNLRIKNNDKKRG